MVRTVLVNGLNIPRSLNIINRNSTYKNPGWFIRKSAIGLFGITPSIAELLEDMRAILDGMYGENWQFFFVNRASLPLIIIRYPKLEMTNSLGHQHTIRDLIVSLEMVKRDNKIHISSNIKGLRLTVSREEFISEYVHSHLYSRTYEESSINLTSASYFCLGNNEVPELLSVFNDNQETGTFELFLMTLNTMMEWESLEGTPYIKIDNISNKRHNRSRSYYPTQDDVNTVFDILKDNSILQQADFDMDLDNIKIIENDFLMDEIKRKVTLFHPTLLCKREGDFYLSVNSVDEVDTFSIPQKFIFKGEEIPFKIYNNRVTPIQEESSGNSYQIHPTVLMGAIEQLNNYLYEKSVAYYSRTTTR